MLFRSDWYSQSAMTNISAGDNVTLQAPLGVIPVFVRGGSVLPMQEPGLTTFACRQNPWGLLVALDGSGAANGTLYVDDGESVMPNATLNVVFTAMNGSLSSSSTGSYSASQPLANVTVLGVASEPMNVTLNDQSVSNFTYNSTSMALFVTDLANSTDQGAWAQNWTMTWS